MAIQFHAVLCLVAQRKGMVISMKETSALNKISVEGPVLKVEAIAIYK